LVSDAPEKKYDLVCIGSGPAAQKAAVASAKMGKRVAVVDKNQNMGGVCVQTGTIPSKTMREAILHLSGFRQRSFYGPHYNVKDSITLADINTRVSTVVNSEAQMVFSQLRRNSIDIVEGHAYFTTPNSVTVEAEGYHPRVLTADNFLIATGTTPAENPLVPCDGHSIIDSDMIVRPDVWTDIPREVIVVGAGVVGIEYASMLTVLPKTKVTIVDERPVLLDFLDREIVDSLYFLMRRNGATFRMGEKVSEVSKANGIVTATLASGKRVSGGSLLYAVGRQGATESLNLPTIGLAADKRGRLKVNEWFQTDIPHIYAAGDVIGIPALASSSMEQGRLAAAHMFSSNPQTFEGYTFPYGIYTIPEISMVGYTEEYLTNECINYESGVARFHDVGRGLMIGDTMGMLKILFCPDTLKILGVHVFGESAAELIHLGQACMQLGGTLEFFRDTVFNYPTLAEAYKIAAFNGLNKVERNSGRL